MKKVKERHREWIYTSNELKKSMEATLAHKWLYRRQSLKEIGDSGVFYGEKITDVYVLKLIKKFFKRSKPTVYAERVCRLVCTRCGVESLVVKKRWKLSDKLRRSSEYTRLFRCSVCSGGLKEGVQVIKIVHFIHNRLLKC